MQFSSGTHPGTSIPPPAQPHAQLNASKADDPPALYLQKFLSCTPHCLIQTRLLTSLVALSLVQLCPLLSLFSFWTPIFPLPATKGNKILLLWKLLTAERERKREEAYETSCVETGAYIWLVPVCGQPSMNVESLFPVWKTTDGVTEIGRKNRWWRKTGNKMYGFQEELIMNVGFGRNIHYSYSSPLLHFCSRDDSQH